MSDLDDSEALEEPDGELPVLAGGAEGLFGDYAVLSPGVQIVLEGRPVSAPAEE